MLTIFTHTITFSDNYNFFLKFYKFLKLKIIIFRKKFDINNNLKLLVYKKIILQEILYNFSSVKIFIEN